MGRREMQHRSAGRPLPDYRRYSKNELQKLLQKAKSYATQWDTRECETFFRDKKIQYFDGIMQDSNAKGLMKTYGKDNHGDPRNPINNRLDGLFFNIVPSHQSIYGNTRLFIPAYKMAQWAPHLYFADFYCVVEGRAHYITLVMCKPDSEADRFCQESLVKLSLTDNPFFFTKDTDDGVSEDEDPTNSTTLASIWEEYQKGQITNDQSLPTTSTPSFDTLAVSMTENSPIQELPIQETIALLPNIAQKRTFDDWEDNLSDTAPLSKRQCTNDNEIGVADITEQKVPSDYLMENIPNTIPDCSQIVTPNIPIQDLEQNKLVADKETSLIETHNIDATHQMLMGTKSVTPSAQTNIDPEICNIAICKETLTKDDTHVVSQSGQNLTNESIESGQISYQTDTFQVLIEAKTDHDTDSEESLNVIKENESGLIDFDLTQETICQESEILTNELTKAKRSPKKYFAVRHPSQKLWIEILFTEDIHIAENEKLQPVTMTGGRKGGNVGFRKASNCSTCNI